MKEFYLFSILPNIWNVPEFLKCLYFNFSICPTFFKKKECMDLALQLAALASTVAVLNLESKRLIWVKEIPITS